MTYIEMPNIDDDDLENQMEAILQSDAKIQQQLALLMRDLSGTEKMALGLNAYFLIDQSSTQLCDLKPKHGEYSAELQSGIFLVQQLSPQAKAEFAANILMDDWEMGLVAVDSPSTIIE
jgi:hypothetical protein